MARTGEAEIAVAVMRIADAQARGVATHQRIRSELPTILNLTEEDWVESDTRPGEAMWYQIVRNIRSHHDAEGNFIEMGYLKHISKVGYSITDAGRQYLRRKGY